MSIRIILNKDRIGSIYIYNPMGETFDGEIIVRGKESIEQKQ